jgi:hypothetical protein
MVSSSDEGSVAGESSIDLLCPLLLPPEITTTTGSPLVDKLLQALEVYLDIHQHIRIVSKKDISSPCRLAEKFCAITSIWKPE